MSKATVASARIVRYPDVVAHLTTCATCKAAGTVGDLIYEIGSAGDTRGCAEGRRLDRRRIEAFGSITASLREEVKRFVEPLVTRSMETLGVDARSIVESLETTFQEMLEESREKAS